MYGQKLGRICTIYGQLFLDKKNLDIGLMTIFLFTMKKGRSLSHHTSVFFCLIVFLFLVYTFHLMAAFIPNIRSLLAAQLRN